MVANLCFGVAAQWSRQAFGSWTHLASWQVVAVGLKFRSLRTGTNSPEIIPLGSALMQRSLRALTRSLGPLVLACASVHSASLAQGATRAMPATPSGQLPVSPVPSAALRALPHSELKQLITGRSVTSPVDTTYEPNHQLVEYFYEGGRYVSHRHGREDLGTYFFAGASLCVRTSERVRCRIAIIDPKQRLWLVESFDPANFSEARIGNIPR